MRGPSKKFDNWGNAMKRLQDKVCLVTGGANGLGNAIARRMTEEGASVLLFDKDPKGEKPPWTLVQILMQVPPIGSHS